MIYDPNTDSIFIGRLVRVEGEDDTGAHRLPEPWRYGSTHKWRIYNRRSGANVSANYIARLKCGWRLDVRRARVEIDEVNDSEQQRRGGLL